MAIAITEIKNINKSDGSSLVEHRGVLLFADYHQEYTGCWSQHESRWSPDDYFYAKVLWDGVAIYDLMSAARKHDRTAYGDLEIEQAQQEVFDKMFEGVEWREPPMPASQDIWMIDGNESGVKRAFRLLYDALDVTPGGDDDFFDYWPNSMDILWDFARDLDVWDSIIHGARLQGRIDWEWRQQVDLLVRRVWDRRSDAGENGVEEDYRREWFGREWIANFEQSLEG